MNSFNTIDEATRAIKKAMEQLDFETAAQYILENGEPFLSADGYTNAPLSHWWITWVDAYEQACEDAYRERHGLAGSIDPELGEEVQISNFEP